MRITDKLKGKRILIWGYGREGKSTKNFIDNYCNVKSVDIFEGKKEEIDENEYDYIIKSPGIPVLALNEKYTSQTELFVDEFRDKIIGVTGTKGKSTTSSMLFYVLSKCSKKNVILVGNIGLPCLDHYAEIDENTIIVYEMSCHQLAHLSVSPGMAVFLNLHEDHLDYYKTMDRYFKAKCNIFLNMDERGTAYIGSQVPLENVNTTGFKGKIVIVDENKTYNYNLKLCGRHNQFNAEVVYEIVSSHFCSNADMIKEAMSEFNGLSHRLEFAGEYDGIAYYDDSISTICSSAINAVNAIADCETVLIGGMDRGIDYSELADFIKIRPDVKFICMYAAGKRVAEMSEGCANVYLRNDLKEAVELAKQITGKGKACILSPAAASYDAFKNFEERGNVFKKLIKEK